MPQEVETSENIKSELLENFIIKCDISRQDTEYLEEPLYNDFNKTWNYIDNGLLQKVELYEYVNLHGPFANLTCLLTKYTYMQNFKLKYRFVWKTDFAVFTLVNNIFILFGSNIGIPRNYKSNDKFNITSIVWWMVQKIVVSEE